MFERISPEQAGISSDNITKFLSIIERHGAIAHGFLMMKGGKIFAEEYWKPFDKDFCHRMYSQTKSFVGVAIGLLEEEGKLSLDDKISQYFPEKIDGEPIRFLQGQTIREMLMMTTVSGGSGWKYQLGDLDKVHFYFNHERKVRPSGTYWQYDSSGSQVLCSLVEKLSGKRLLDYMKERLFNRMGTFQTATVLQNPCGDSWGDSALLCTLRDMASFGYFVMHRGIWEGERLMNEDYLSDAISKLVDNRTQGYCSMRNYGYGYQIWRIMGNGFAFLGLGNQLTLCYPEKDLLFTYVADDQPQTNVLREIICGAFLDLIVEPIKERSLPENKAAQKRYEKATKNLKLFAVQGKECSPFKKELQGKVYFCEKNPMGIKKFSFRFKRGDTGEFRYTNEQGDKVIPFGINRNVFGKFPELGYHNDYDGVPTTDGFMHDDAVSFAWAEEKKIILYVQIIGRYFGNISAVFAFKDDAVAVSFTKCAQNFLTEYEGTLVAHRARKSKK